MGVQFMNIIITATEIDTWAKAYPRKAQEILPELIIRLILCTSSQIEDYNFPIEKGIQYSGYDGTLIASEASSYFPAGKSVWEFGTNDDALSKFSSDIDKRHGEPLGVSVGDTAFIFATLKIWNHKTSIEELINESKTKYDWKDIRIIDGSKIALWLQTHTAVATWFANIMGKHIDGIRTLEDYWKDYCSTTVPSLNAEYFLIGREGQIDYLTKWDGKKSGCHTLISESVLESTLFLIAYALKHNKSLLGQALIVESVEAWNRLIAKKESCLLVPVFNFTEEIRCPTEMFVILPVAQYSPISKITKNIESIRLIKRSKSLYHKALEAIGYQAIDFTKVETETKRNFLPLYRMITTIPTRKQPKWLSEPNAIDLIPAFLAGGWNENYEGDKEAIEMLTGLKYEEYIQKITRWLSIEDAPIFRVFNVYQMVTIPDMWTFLFDSLTERDISKLQNCVVSVFGAENPTFDLPEDQWCMAPVLGKEPKCSELLRQGLTISLILLAEQENRDNNCNINSAEHYVSSVVRLILEPVKTWKQWSTIAPSLMLLTEASPEAVLKKIEQEISNAESEMWMLFKPPKDVLMGRSYYTHILWSLEQLVWYENYAVRAIFALVSINERKCEYTLANSPINSLYEVFCTWYPQTCLNCEQRVEVLRNICKTYPETGKELIDKLMPTGHSTCGSIQKPRWHNFEQEFREGVTGEDYNITLQAIANIATELAVSAGHWTMIIDNLSFFLKGHDSWGEKLVKYCKLHKTKSSTIADTLRERISRNREFCNAEWAISEEHLTKMEQLLSQILPEESSQYEYLFKERPNLLHPIPFDGKKFDYEKRCKHLRKIRIDTIYKILNEYGTTALIDFSLKAEATEELAEIIAKEILQDKYDFSLFFEIKKSNVRLYTSLLKCLFQANGLKKLLLSLKGSSLTAEEQADIICYSPLDPMAWEILDSLGEGAAQYYWEHINAFWLPPQYNQHFDYFLDHLLKYKRPFSAARMIVFSEYQNPSMIMRILKKCCELQNYIEPTGVSLESLANHDIHNLFEKLYKSKNMIDIDELVQLEISFFGYFRFSATPQGIVKYLQENPREYVNLIACSYKPDTDFERPKKKYSAEQIRLALNVVEAFTQIPGCMEGGVSEERFNEWILAAQSHAETIGYKRSFSSCLGRLLSYSPVGTDGIFPHEIIRTYFEHNHDKRVINNFISGKVYQRGVHVVTGGMEEKEISQKYREDAKKMRITHPQTAAILDKLADSYWQESLYEQKRELMDFSG